MRVDRLKAKAVVELEEELATVRGERAALDAKSAEDLWLADLEAFADAYERFVAVREEARAQVAAESVGAKKKAPVKRVKKNGA
jgi:hypothetical protein